jgi:hypothetical protein
MERELLALNRRADVLHKDEKAPVLERERAIDDKYRFRETVAAFVKKLKLFSGNFLRAEEAREKAEAARRFHEEQARVAAERARIEAERTKQKEDEPVAFHTSPEPEMPELPVAPEPVKVTGGGGFGRRAGLTSVWVATLSNVDTALAHYRDNAKVLELIQKLANADVKTGKRSIPGFEITEERRRAA